MKRALFLGPVLAIVVLVFAGCPVPGAGVTITGSMLGYYYFNIWDEVQVTFAQGNASVTLHVPVTSAYNQEGAFVVANLPPGDYSVVMSFDADSSAIDSADGTTYSIDGGVYVPVDGEVVAGSASPYTHTITIDSLSIDADMVVDIYLGNLE